MALKEILARFGFEIDDKPLKKADKDVDSFAKKVVSAFAAAEIVNGMRSFVTGMIRMEGQITDTADALGIGRQALQEWNYIGERGGASAEDMASSFKFLQKNAAEGAAAFKKLGVDVKGADGQIRPVEALMGDVADGLANVQNPAERTKLALELLGKGGTKLLPILSKGGKEVEALRRRFKELGGGLSEEALDAIGNLGDAVQDVELATTSLKGNLMLALAPSLRWLTNAFADAVAYFNKGESAANRVKAALTTMGVVGAAAGFAMLRPYLPFLATVAAIYLVVQDFLTFLDGGDSVVGAIITWLFGAESADTVRGWVKGVADEVKQFAKDMEAQDKGLIAGFFQELGVATKHANEQIQESGGAWEDWAVSAADAFSLFGSHGKKSLAFLGEAGDEFSAFNKAIFDALMKIGDDMSAIMKGWFDAAVEAARSLGRGIAEGIAAGFTGGAKTLEDKGAAAIEKMLAAMKGPKGADAHSPSRKGIKLGQDIVAGPIVGMMSKLGELQAASVRVANVALPVHSTTNYSNRTANVRNQITINAANDPRAVAGAVSGAMSTFDWNGWQGSIA